MSDRPADAVSIGGAKRNPRSENPCCELRQPLKVQHAPDGGLGEFGGERWPKQDPRYELLRGGGRLDSLDGVVVRELEFGLDAAMGHLIPEWMSEPPDFVVLA